MIKRIIFLLLLLPVFAHAQYTQYSTTPVYTLKSLNGKLIWTTPGYVYDPSALFLTSDFVNQPHSWLGMQTFRSTTTFFIDPISNKRLVLNGRGMQSQAVNGINNDTLQLNPNGGNIQIGNNVGIIDATKKTILMGDDSNQGLMLQSTADYIATGSTNSGGIPKFRTYGVGHQGYFFVDRQNGTRANPLVLNNNDFVGSFGALGYNGLKDSQGNNIGTHLGEMRIYANENFTTTAAGGRFEFWVTPNGSINETKSLSINSTSSDFSNNVNVANNLTTNTLNINAPAETSLGLTELLGRVGSDRQIRSYPLSSVATAFGLRSFAYKSSLNFNELQAKPTTLSGFGITDTYTAAQSDGRYPQLQLTYQNPTWIATLDYNKLFNTPIIPNLTLTTTGTGSATLDKSNPSNYTLNIPPPFVQTGLRLNYIAIVADDNGSVFNYTATSSDYYIDCPIVSVNVILGSTGTTAAGQTFVVQNRVPSNRTVVITTNNGWMINGQPSVTVPNANAYTVYSTGSSYNIKY